MLQYLIVAFGIGTGVGVNALLAKSLGQNDKEKVATVAGNGITLGIVIYILFLLFGIFGIDIYLQTQSDNEIILSMSKEYLFICTILSFGIIMFSICEKLLQSTGKTLYSTIAQIAGAITNVVLDPIMIFGYFGCPQLGISGAAYATVIGQIVSMAVAMLFHYLKNTEVKNGLKYLKPNFKIIKEIYVIGLPAIIMQALMSFMTYGINIIFGSVSTAAVTAYGIFYKIQQFLFFACFGLRDAITPIVSFNFGMKDQKRVKEGIKYGIIYILAVMIIGIFALQVSAEPLVMIFGLSDETASLCVLAIRIISAGFIFAGVNIALQGVFQALGCGISSLVVSVLRLFIVVLPPAMWFTTFSNAEYAIWFAFPISECVAFLVAIIFMIRANKKIIEPLLDKHN
ncbi:MAG: MATE family efflux transporter [Acutalibacteraceae bacterium]|nr:MATE family efflux transporter [Acutalibacteraceae bacterium]